MREKKMPLKLVSIGLVFAVLVGGCSSKNEEYGSKKEDYKVGKPPEGWIGPGDPNAPGARPPAIPQQGK